MADAYEAASLVERAEFVQEVQRRAFDFLEQHFGPSTEGPVSLAGPVEEGDRWPVALPAGVAAAAAPILAAAKSGAVGPALAPGPDDLPALENLAVALEHEEGVYSGMIEERAEGVPAQVATGWKDRLKAIRERLDEARTVITDIGKGAVSDVQEAAQDVAAEVVEAVEDLADVGGEVVEAAEELLDAAAAASGVVEEAAAEANIQHGPDPTEGEGCEPTNEDGTVPSAEDGTEPAIPAAEDEAAVDRANIPFAEALDIVTGRQDSTGPAEEEEEEEEAPATRHVSVDHEVTHRDVSGKVIGEDPPA